MIKSETIKLYGRKLISDNGDSYYVDNEVIGEKEVHKVRVVFKDNAPKQMLRAALAASPQEACLRHLTRLAIHKKIGSNDGDRAILLSDYVTALSSFPEFVIFSVCKNYWENDRRPFIPYIDEIREACQKFMILLDKEARKTMTDAELLEEEKKPQISGDRRLSKYYKELSKNEWLPIHYDQWVKDAEDFIAFLQKNPSFGNLEEWREILKTRIAERQKAIDFPLKT